MKKCRRFIRKIPVSVLVLLIMISGFFYAPMKVDAADTVVSDSISISKTLNDYYNVRFIFESEEFDLLSGIDPDKYYSVEYTLDGYFQTSKYLNLYSVYFNYGNHQMGYFESIQKDSNDTTFKREFKTSGVLVGLGSSFQDNVFTGNTFTLSNTSGTVTATLDYDIRIDSVSVVSSEQSGDYQSGYNAGYAAGLAQGESNGYSSGYDAGYTEGESTGYDSGFQAGVDSVDTQSYYDAGYTAGYDAGYREGYDSGYDDGYDDAMSRVEGWGADGSDYPVILYSDAAEPLYTDSIEVRTSSDVEILNYDTVTSFRRFTDVIDIDPDHTYSLSVLTSLPQVQDNNLNYAYYDLFITLGGREYPLNQYGMYYKLNAFIPGDVFTDDIGLGVRLYGAYSNSSSAVEGTFRLYFDNTAVELFDYGPSGNTQNHIANQTDQLTNGYDSSVGDSTSSAFSDGVLEYETVEGSLFTSAKTGLTDYQFFDIQSVPAVVTGLSFVTSIMTGIFNSMGGASGAGIVLSVLFSVMLVSIVAGLYRYFVSSGRSGKHDKKGGGK